MATIREKTPIKPAILAPTIMPTDGLLLWLCEDVDEGSGVSGLVDVADFTAAVNGMAAPVVVVDMANLVMVNPGAEVLVETVVVVGPESDFEFHVMGVSAWFGRILKFALFKLRPSTVVSVRSR